MEKPRAAISRPSSIKRCPRHWTSVPACPDPGASQSCSPGRCDSQWVETEGTVRAVAAEGQDAALTLVSGPCKIQSRSFGSQGRNCPYLIDAKVRIQGACGSIFNDRRQLLSIQVLVPEISHLRVLDRPAAAPHSLPVQAINALLQFSPEQPAEHRVRIQGVVTLRRPTGTVFVADTTGGVPIEAPREFLRHARRSGRRRWLSAQGGYLAVLENAVFQKQSRGPPRRRPGIRRRKRSRAATMRSSSRWRATFWTV